MVLIRLKLPGTISEEEEEKDEEEEEDDVDDKGTAEDEVDDDDDVDDGAGPGRTIARWLTMFRLLRLVLPPR